MKVSKVLLVLSLVIGLVMVAGKAMAATSALEGVPGGATVVPFQASAAGLGTIINFQNVAGTEDAAGPSSVAPQPMPTATPSTPAILVHCKIFDADTNYLASFNVPLSPRDNVGIYITGDGTNIYLTSLGPEHFTLTLPGSVGLAADANGLQIGYLSVAITASDDAGYGGNGNGDPIDDPNLTLGRVMLPSWLMVRYALVDTVTQSHADINALMLQVFINVPQLNEANTFVDTWPAANIADAYDWNGDGDTADTFNSMDTVDGIVVDPWELYVYHTETFTWTPNGVVADDPDGNGVGNILYPAWGSVNGVYWARWNVNPSLSITSSLYTLFPASGGFFASVSGPQGNRHMHLLIYDDNEHHIDDDLTPAEMAVSPIDGTTIVYPGGALAGDIMIQLDGLNAANTSIWGLSSGGRIANMNG
ncbi:MAG: hypothetical protein LWW90_04950, partial [Candidatus Desulfofervidus auxilii]|nr:hypothetical protein [Candidatus Desulfofervidus auxilii]